MDVNKISQSQLDKLLRAEAKLNALEAGGVDNWEGYDFALEGYRKEERENELIDDFAESILQAVSETADVDTPSCPEAGYAIYTEASEQDVKQLLRKMLNEFRDT